MSLRLHLSVISGPSTGQSAIIDGPMILGRDKKCRIQLDDERISRHHALIESNGSEFMIKDLGSKNGTFLNGVEIKAPHVLRPGDQIRIGQTLLRAQSPQTTETVDAPPQTPSKISRENVTVEVHRDHPTEDSVQIQRSALRAAAELTSEIGMLLSLKASHQTMLSRIIESFNAASGAITGTTQPYRALATEGGFRIVEGFLDELDTIRRETNFDEVVLLSGGQDRPSIRNKKGRLLLIPCKDAEGAYALILLQRIESAPFTVKDLHLGEAFAECMRILPFRKDLDRKDQAVLLDEPLALVGSSDIIVSIRKRLEELAQTEAPILLTGEKGTGKCRTSEYLTRHSSRSGEAYLAVDASLLSPETAEKELLGEEESSGQETTSILANASGGTLYIQHIEVLSDETQLALYKRMKAMGTINPDVRIIASTSLSLDALRGKSGVLPKLLELFENNSVRLPALRDHIEDIPELVDHLIKILCADLHLTGNFSISPKVYRRLLSYRWPGNIGELKGVLHHLLVLAKGPMIEESDLPANLLADMDTTTFQLPRLQILTEVMEREEITRALNEAEGQKSAAAKSLGISRPTLDKKIKQYRLEHLTSRTRDATEDHS